VRSTPLTSSLRAKRSNLYYQIMEQKQFYVYIATNKTNTVLYVGITNNIIRRGYEHKQELVSGFTSRYKIHKIVYYEIFSTALEALTREKQIKGGSRKKKIDLIKSMNSEFKDLYEDLV